MRYVVTYKSSRMGCSYQYIQKKPKQNYCLAPISDNHFYLSKSTSLLILVNVRILLKYKKFVMGIKRVVRNSI